MVPLQGGRKESSPGVAFSLSFFSFLLLSLCCLRRKFRSS
ncbi:MAG: GlyGly-CTERM sorting domain-containing protein [Candidatus Saccharicenans sp.]|nr:GlyGly-CTERM sorting domain-containing protein [Candidatus Saccharicenans sp.]